MHTRFYHLCALALSLFKRSFFSICISYFLMCLFHLVKERSYFSWVAPVLLQNTNKSYIRPKINMILPKSAFIPLSDCLSTLEALLCCRTEKRLVKEGGREGNVRAVGLGNQVFCWFVEFAVLVWMRGSLRTLKDGTCGQASWCDVLGSGVAFTWSGTITFGVLLRAACCFCNFLYGSYAI